MANKISFAKRFLKWALPVLALLAIGWGWNAASTGLAQGRQIRVVNTSGVAGQTVTVAVELVAQGNENALGFSLNFPTAIFSTPSVSLGTGATGANFNVNLNQAPSGRIGVAMALPTGQVFAAGTRQILTIGFVVPANAPAGPTMITFGDVPVAREVADANANSLATTFTSGDLVVQQPNPVPTLTSLSPTSAIVGSNGVLLTVNGSNFVALSTVRWNGITRTTQFVNSGQLTATIPASDLVASGTASVDVVNPSPGGGTSNSLSFAINNPAPTITSLSPNSATAGGAAFTLTVNGTGFLNSSTVWWNGAQRTTQFVSATQVTASISANDIASAGTANVVVQNPAPGGGSSPSAIFTINNPVPTLASLDPNNAVLGGPAFTLTVTGTGFVASSVVRWNGSPRATQFVSDTQLTASILANDLSVALPANVTVANPSPGGGISNAGNFMVTTQVTPIVASLSPATVIAGGPAFTLTVNGNNFVNGSILRWNGDVRPTTFVSANQITAAITAADIALPSTYTVTVTNPPPGGGASLPIPYQVTSPVPVLTSIAPTSATAGGAGLTLTVNGSNFVSFSVVRWNGIPRTTQFVSATQLIATIPAADIASAGIASVTVSTVEPGGGVSAAANFTINNLNSSTTSITPSVAVAGGAAFVLTVTGTNFVFGSTVNWNGSGRSTTFVSATQLTAQIPATDIATAGTAAVTVVTPAPGGGTSNAQTFTIASPVASVSAASFLGAELAPDSIIAAFGVNMATSVEVAATSPLPTMLAGTKVVVKDSAGVERLAPLFFVAPTQVNYLMPPGTANGVASVTVTSGDNKISLGAPLIASVAPGLFTANSSGVGIPAANIFRLKANGEQSTEPLSRLDSATNQIVPIPIDLGPEGEQVFVILFGSGIKGNTGLSAVNVKIGGTDCEVLYAGETPGFFGLDQCNVRIPRSLDRRGDVDVVLTVNGKIANTVRINIK